MPDSNPLYNLLGGYYPGDPIPRKRHYGDYPSPLEFNSDTWINNYLYGLNKELSKLSVKEQARNLFIDDVARQLRARATPKEATYDPMRAIELGDEEDVAGVQVGIDINPVKWVQDPGEMLQKTGKQWFNDFVNWSDFSSYVEREKLWKPLLEGKEVSPIVGYAYGDHLEGDTPAGGPMPFQLYGLELTTPEQQTFYDTPGDKKGIKLDREVDLFQESGMGFKKFTRSARASAARDTSFAKFTNQAAIASSSELINLLQTGQITDPQHKTEIKSYLHRARALRTANALNGRGDKNYIFAKEGEFAEFGSGVGSGLAALSSDLGKYTFGRANEKRVGSTYKKIFGDEETGNIGSLGEAKKVLEEADKHFESLGAVAKAEFEKDTKPLRSLLKDIEGLKGSDIKSKPGVINLKGKINLIQAKHASAGAFKGGVNNMNRKFLENHFVKGPMRKIISDPQNSSIVGTRNLLNVSEEALRFYKREDFYDLINMLEKDGVVGVAADVVWNLVRKRLNGFTPASVLGEQLKKVHYFGLLYDERYGEGDNTGSKTMNNIMSKGRLSKLFDNKHSVNVELDGVTKSFSFVGHKNLRFGAELYARRGAKGAQHITQQDFVDMINFKERDYGELVKTGKALRHGLEYEKARASSASLRDWLKRHNDQLGLEFDNIGKLVQSEENARKLEAVFKSLIKYEGGGKRVSIFQSKAGLMQKFSQTLSLLQEKLFKSKLGKLLSAPAYMREVVSKAASKTVTKVLAKVLSGIVVAGTEGIGATIYPYIEKVIQYVLNKLENLVGKIGKALWHADANIIDSFVESSAQALYKVFGCCALSFGMPIAVVMIIFIFLLSAITPVDPTRTAFGMTDGIGPGLSVMPVDCTFGEREPTGLAPTGNAVADRAIEIANGLERGFWCGWNKHVPEYEEFWDEGEFQRNPWPPVDYDTWDSMFWCTYLVIESYSHAYDSFPSYPEDAGKDGPWWYLIAARNLANTGFRDAGHYYWSQNELPASELQAGDAIFFRGTSGRSNAINHVAIVHSVHDGVVTTIHANAWAKVIDFNIGSDGYLQDHPLLEVVSFARWRE